MRKQKNHTFSFLFVACRYVAVIGVATHPETVRRYELQLEHQEQPIVAVARKSISQWKAMDGSVPFKPVVSPSHALCCLNLFPSYLSRVSELSAASSGQVTPDSKL